MATFYCQFDMTLKLPGLGEPQLKNCLGQISLCPRVWGIVLIGGWCGRAWPTIGSIIPRQVGLGYVRKLAEFEPVSQPLGRLLPLLFFAILLLLRANRLFPPQHPPEIDCILEVQNEIDLFVKLLLVMVFIHSHHQDLMREWMLKCFDNCQLLCKVKQLLSRIFMLAGTFMFSSRLVL